MKIGGIEFVTYTALSEAFENFYTLLRHSYDYNGNHNSTMNVQYGSGEEYDLSEEDLKDMAEELNRDPEEKIVAEMLYADICEQKGLMLVSYEEMEKLEELYFPHALFNLYDGQELNVVINNEKWSLYCKEESPFLSKIKDAPPESSLSIFRIPYPYNAFDLSKEELKKEICGWIWENRKEILKQYPFYW